MPMSLPPNLSESSQQPLEYAMARPKRPGILTAVGIISIVVGSLSVLASVSGVASGVIYIVMSHVRFPVPPQPTTMAAITPTTAPAGSSNSTFSYYYAVHTSGGNATSYSSTSNVPFSFRIGTGPSVLMITESALSLGVAVFLIVAGSRMLRDLPGTARLHRIYVVLKVPLIAAGAVATYWTFTSMMNGLSMTLPRQSASPFPAWGMMAAFQAIASAAVSLIYPVALLIVLGMRSNREYFAVLQKWRR
jgi:hypothetical protein